MLRPPEPQGGYSWFAAGLPNPAVFLRKREQSVRGADRRARTWPAARRGIGLIDMPLFAVSEPVFPEPFPTQGVGASLSCILDVLRSSVLRVVSTPRGLEDVRVSNVMIYHPSEPCRIGRGDVVLAVGLDIEDWHTLELLHTAGRAGAAAVVLKMVGPHELQRIANVQLDQSVAILGVPEHVRWGDLHSLIDGALNASIELHHDERCEHTLPDEGFSLADALAGGADGAVIIFDRYWRLVAYSSREHPVDDLHLQTILARRLPLEARRRLEDEGVVRRLLNGESGVRQEASADGVRPRLFVAVRAGDQFLGAICLTEGVNRPRSGEKAAVLGGVALAAALLLRARAGDDLDQRHRDHLVRGVLDGSTPASVLKEAHLPGPGSWVVLALEPVTPEGHRIPWSLGNARAMAAINHETGRPGAIVARVGDRFYVLMPIVAQASQEVVAELADEVRRRVNAALGVRLRAGAGSIVSFDRIACSRSEADHVLRSLRDMGSDIAAMTIEQMKSKVLLTEFAAFLDDHPHLRHEKLDKLHALDTNRGTSYIITLRAYLDSFGDIPQAAKFLNVHPTTLRYRLRRIRELTGLDIHDPDDRLAAQLLVR